MADGDRPNDNVDDGCCFPLQRPSLVWRALCVGGGWFEIAKEPSTGNEAVGL